MKIKKFPSFLFVFLGVFFLTGQFEASEKDFEYDVLIKNTNVFDGSLKPSFKSDVAVKNGIIVKVSKSINGRSARIIDAKNLYISPGFIDLHTHVDRGMYYQENRACLNYLKQGVTTIVAGQCGSSAWPIFEKAEDQMKRWTEEGIGPNAALLVGHGTVRQIVMGMEDRAPTPEELDKMKALVKEAMEQGASGLSTGLIYLPGRYSQTDEIIELVKIIVPFGGIYHTHIRNEADKLLDAVKEAVEIAKKTGAPTHISHFKVILKNNWGLVKNACEIIEEARQKGIKITADQYPYQFHSGNPYQSLIPSSTWTERGRAGRITTSDINGIFDHLRDSQLIALYKKTTPYIPITERHEQFLRDLPRKRLVSFVSGNLMNANNFTGPANPKDRMLFLKRLKNPVEAEKIRKEITEYIDITVGPENFIIGVCVEKKLEGISLKRAAEVKGKSVAETAIELELMGAKCIPLQMCEPDIEFIMKKDYVGTGSDGTARFFGIGLPHIRSYSTFLHKIKKYALQRKTVSLPHVIRSQTSLPAQIMSWNDRGWIKEGYKADIVVLDLDHIKINTSISNPHAYSEGVEYLLVNGKLVLDKGEWNGALVGGVIKLKQP
ncbi:amidohydrolase family protein [Acidobacteriota bacterium]